LFLLAGFVDDESGALGFLLRYLFGFYGSGELGREGQMLKRMLVIIFHGQFKHLQ
jgi:hypothetical protein